MKNGRPTRSVFLPAGVVGLVALICAGSAQESKAPPAPRGDSIFHETMVDMTWPEVKEAAEAGAIVLTNTAVIEEHGPHMSCGIDTYLGYHWCKSVRRELEARGIRTVIAPPFYWGVNRTTNVFPGTFTVRPETMKAVLHDMFASLQSWGFQDVFNINSHMDGLHVGTGIQAVQASRAELGMNLRYVIAKDQAARFGLSGEEEYLLPYDGPDFDLSAMEHLDLHAGHFETSVVAAYFPEQVDEELARTLEPTEVGLSEIRDWITDPLRITPQGYLGDPASFDVEEGRRLWEEECVKVADAIEAFVKKE